MRAISIFLSGIMLTFLGCSSDTADLQLAENEAIKQAFENIKSSEADFEAHFEIIPDFIPIAEAAEVSGEVREIIKTVAAETSAPSKEPKEPQDDISFDYKIQVSLRNAGLYHGKLDGIVGPRTRKAIRSFQTLHDLKPDGQVGTKTWMKLSQFYSSSEVE